MIAKARGAKPPAGAGAAATWPASRGGRRARSAPDTGGQTGPNTGAKAALHNALFRCPRPPISALRPLLCCCARQAPPEPSLSHAFRGREITLPSLVARGIYLSLSVPSALHSSSSSFFPQTTTQRPISATRQIIRNDPLSIELPSNAVVLDIRHHDWT